MNQNLSSRYLKSKPGKPGHLNTRLFTKNIFRSFHKMDLVSIKTVNRIIAYMRFLKRPTVSK